MGMCVACPRTPGGEQPAVNTPLAPLGRKPELGWLAKAVLDLLSSLLLLGWSERVDSSSE